jgi:magnesium transporter
MFYFSEVLNAKILDDREEYVGKVRDVAIFDSGDSEKYPPIKGVVFIGSKKDHFISYEDIEVFGPKEITLKKTDCWIEMAGSQNEILLNRDLMDKQIFDIDSIRVVRVNDLELAKINDRFCLVAADISFNAILRRLGLPLLPAAKITAPKLIDWKNIDFLSSRDAAGLRLKTSREKLNRLHPADIANLIENLNLRDSSMVIKSFDADKAADILAEVEPKYKDILLEHIDPEHLSTLVEKMPSDEATDVIQDLSHRHKGRVLEKLGAGKADIIRQLSAYEERDAGSIMTTDFLSISGSSSISEAIEMIRTHQDKLESIYHLFVTDMDNRLTGVVSIRSLLLGEGKAMIKDIMSKAITMVSPHAKNIDVARLMTKYNLLSAAVVDSDKKIIGIITIDDIMRILIPNA